MKHNKAFKYVRFAHRTQQATPLNYDVRLVRKMENGSKKKPCYGVGHFEREAKIMVGVFFALIIVALLAGAIAPWIL